jgi:putative inorganic carbon (HCO3(-)) transporter
LIKSSPIFGVGYDMFLEDLSKTAHNSFILAAAELGLVGLFFWMSLIYMSYKGLSIIQEKSENLRQYARALQAGLIGFCASAFFLSRTYIIIPYIIFALAGSLMHVAKKEDNNLEFTFKKADVKIVIIWCLCVLGAAYATIKVGI